MVEVEQQRTPARARSSREVGWDHMVGDRGNHITEGQWADIMLGFLRLNSGTTRARL